MSQEELVVYKRMPVWQHDTVPGGFLKRHNTKEGTWAQLKILRGSLQFALMDEHGNVTAEATYDTEHQPPRIEPQAWHQIVSMSPDIQCQLDFLCRPADYFTKKYDMTATHSEVVEAAEQVPVGRALDIGCGGGNTLARMAERVTEGHLVGIDYAETSVEASRAFNAALVERGRMEILHGSVEALPFADGHFDAVVTVESFYFWPSPEESLREVARVVREGGSFLLLAEICGRDDLPESTRAKVAEYQLTNPTPTEFEQLFRAAGFREVQIHLKEGEYWIAVVGVR